MNTRTTLYQFMDVSRGVYYGWQHLAITSQEKEDAELTTANTLHVEFNKS